MRPAQVTLDVIGKKWKPVLVALLGEGDQRFRSLTAATPETTHKVITEQLRELERDGVLVRRAAPRGRKHVTYSLTPAGRQLLPLLALMRDWGEARQRELRYEMERDRGVPNDPRHPGVRPPRAPHPRGGEQPVPRPVVGDADRRLSP